MALETFAFRLICALVAGLLIGIERQLRHQQAGLTTNALVAIGACIYILISESVLSIVGAQGNSTTGDQLRVLAQVVTGIGFLGAGVIMKNGTNIHGLGSAATIWCSAAMGCLCGYGLWKEAAISLGVILFVNWFVKGLEIKIRKKQDKKSANNN